ncbi:MAG: hypothetical protein JST10_06580 [Bacteroidetes bacterium]|nr:hypothetical protein [Bacteroidota bacterium]MBS1632224.1 hypothetical protein [Bacteroidota bacterium]
MRIVVLADNRLKKELLAQGVSEKVELIWLKDIEKINEFTDTDACIDLLFDPDPARIEILKKMLPGPIFVNSVTTVLRKLPDGFVRFNGWPTFLKNEIIEAACLQPATKEKSEVIFSFFNKKIEWTADQPGFISARIVSMIINEAYFACGEGISSKDEIDVAMKLGTNYPYGPFEWAGLIGTNNIFGLLKELSSEYKLYEPADLLQKEFQL